MTVSRGREDSLPYGDKGKRTVIDIAGVESSRIDLGKRKSLCFASGRGAAQVVKET